ncbi:MAG: sulfide/dihydroorotate dehydrogenase-like FAD/NAD-binding protein [Clostridia bacterium]|nr:sulfide/dihydroorotate dehydrogenase-like FAD/NAD-binding protein [Clostridia bacterium]
MFKIVRKYSLNDTTDFLSVYAPRIAAKAKPGQFIIFRIDETGERIPLTIAGYDRAAGTVSVIFQKVGKSTIKLGEMKEGDEILDFVGPLGTPSHLDGYRRVAVIGGGLGCAIAYPQAKYLHEQGTEVDMIVGFRSKDIIILEEEMRACSNTLTILTDDGSNGNQGLVTDGLKQKIESGAQYDLVIAIGPPIMMKFVCRLTKQYGIKTIVSMNPIMIDGTGMCGGCRVTVGGKIKFACVDGPDFDGHEVDFDELIRRNRMYAADERHARDAHCNLMKMANTEQR